MESDRLKQFCLILETGSLSKAAELLGISHGGLSKSMSTLQSELGIALFQPHGRGIIPTDAGKNLYKRAHEVVEKIEALKKPARESLELTHRIGALEVFIGPVLSELPPETLEERFEILELNPGKIEVALSENRIDVGFTYLPVPLEGVEYLKVANFKFGIYARKNTFKGMKLEDIPFVAPISEAPSNPLGIKERDVWPDGLFPRKKKFQVNLLSTAMELAHNGECAIFIPDLLATHHNSFTSGEFRLEALPFPSQFPKPTYHVFMVKREGSEETKLTKKLAAAFRRLTH